MLILHAAREVVESKDLNFEETLNSVRNRIDEIESLHRTRELTVSTIIILAPNHFTYQSIFRQFKDLDNNGRISLVQQTSDGQRVHNYELTKG